MEVKRTANASSVAMKKRGKTMKILFINAIDHTKPIQTQFPPLGIGYLVSSLREMYGKDTIEFKVVHEHIMQAITEFKPDIIGISSVSQNFNLACLLYTSPSPRDRS